MKALGGYDISRRAIALFVAHQHPGIYPMTVQCFGQSAGCNCGSTGRFGRIYYKNFHFSAQK
jgi:hypothetical protein